MFFFVFLVLFSGCARALSVPTKGMLTNDAINLYEKFVHRLIRLRSYPIHGRLIYTDTSEHDLRRVGHIDAEDVD